MVVRINYEVDESQVEAANKAIEKLTKNTDDAQDSSDDLTETTAGLNDQLKASANQFQIAGKGAGDLATGMSSARAGVVKFITSLKTLKGAIIATGIGALVIALGSVYAYFTKTERGAQALRVMMAYLGAAIGSVSDVFVSIGETVYNTVVPAIQALVKYWTALYKIVTLDFSGAVGDFKSAFSLIGDSAQAAANGLSNVAKQVSNLGSEIKKDAEEAVELEKRLNAIMVAERQLSIDRAKANAGIVEQKLIIDDATKSYDERIKAAQTALKVENELLEREKALAKERLDIITAQNNLNESSEEALQAQAEAEVTYYNLIEASKNKQVELNTKLIGLQQQEAAAIKAKSQAEQQAILDRQIAEADALADQEEARKLAAQKASDDRRAIEEAEFQRNVKARIDLAVFRKERDAEEETDIQKKTELLIQAENARRNAALLTSQLTADERALLEEQTEARIVDIRRWSAEEQKAINEAKFRSDVDSLQMIAQSTSQYFVKGSKLARAAALFQIQLDQAKAIASLTSASEANPANAVTFGLAGVAQFAAGLARIIGNIKSTVKILNGAPTPQGFADGVIDLQGGVKGKDSIPAMLMPHESVMTARETERFLPTLTAIRKGTIDPETLNQVASGRSGGISIIEVPRDQISIDEDGFIKRTIKKQSVIERKQARYRMR